MSLLNTLNFIFGHPLTRDRKLNAILNWLRWQIGSRILGWSVAVPFVGKARMLVKPSMTGATGNIYYGLHEFEDMAFVLHFLRSGDLFVDVGANIGSYTLLASVAGADTISYEPISETYEFLLDNVYLNRFDKNVDARKQAVGRKSGEMDMIADQDAMNQAILDTEVYTGQTARVDVTSLDEDLGNRVPKVIKIDTEGFETEVLAGAETLLSNSKLLAVIIELNGSGDRYGFDESEIHTSMLTKGFRPCSYKPLSRRIIYLDDNESVSSGNTLYIREVETAQAEVSQSPFYRIAGVDL